LTLPPSLSLPSTLSFFFPSSLYKPSLTLPPSSFFLLYIEEKGKMRRKRGKMTREEKGRKERMREGE